MRQESRALRRATFQKGSGCVALRVTWFYVGHKTETPNGGGTAIVTPSGTVDSHCFGAGVKANSSQQTDGACTNVTGENIFRAGKFDDGKDCGFRTVCVSESCLDGPTSLTLLTPPVVRT